MRSAVVSDWLAQTEFSSWQRIPMTGDASSRRYERLQSAANTSVILMDAPPDTCGSQSRFVEIAKHLRGLNLAAPDILEWNDALGLMILEDLGNVDFAGHLRTTPYDERLLYENAVDMLLALQSAPPPTGLIAMTPQVGADMIGIAFEWAATDQSPDLNRKIKTEVKRLLTMVDPNPNVLSLRDFHAENLIWRPEQSGLNRVGLLDFQDAFVTHPTYDLASLLRDARRDVQPDRLDELLPRFATDTRDIGDMKAAFHIMAVQRNLRILGIFNRLAHQNGKIQYQRLIPRVRHHLDKDLSHPICATLAPLVQCAFAETEIKP
ncbi:phosphotransferase [Octadecabacter sp.]|nr:phosphotransferase [Octadecabacter sp.]